MKSFISIFIFLFFGMFLYAQPTVTYKLDYNMGTQTYTVSMKSNTAFSGPMARMSGSVQFTVVAPHVPGGWLATNVNTAVVTAPFPPSWTYTPIDGTTLVPPIPGSDYLLFTLANANTYTPFSIPADAYIDLFTFKSNSGCVGDLALFDNINDPLNSNPNYGGDNNMVILGASAFGNIYVGNDSGNIPCSIPPPPCTAEAGVLGY